MELKYDVPLTYTLFMRGVLYSLWKSRAFLLAIAMLAAIYSALFHPLTGALTLVAVAGITWLVSSQKYRRLCKALDGKPIQKYTFTSKDLIVETKGLGKMELLREHASTYKIYSDALYLNYIRTNGVCVFLPTTEKAKTHALERLQKLHWLQSPPETDR